VDEQDPEKLIASGLCVGNPDEVRRAVKKYEDVGVDVLGMIPRTSWIEPQEVVLRSLATTGREVLPAFRHSPSAAPREFERGRGR
jgi:alkanesulfonate monooxygenase SsuD/methylene tetrahydromethanopterin reductase-like flavin-dependent oxidoreductase (luciferase family)